MVSEVEPCGVISIPLSVIPAKAGIHVWIPAYAGMTLPHVRLSVGLSGVEARLVPNRSAVVGWPTAPRWDGWPTASRWGGEGLLNGRTAARRVSSSLRDFGTRPTSAAGWPTASRWGGEGLLNGRTDCHASRNARLAMTPNGKPDLLRWLGGPPLGGGGEKDC
jgi:hypothetical protein